MAAPERWEESPEENHADSESESESAPASQPPSEEEAPETAENTLPREAAGDADQTRRPVRVERVEPAPRLFVRLLNPFVKLWLRSPLHVLLSHTFCLLSFTGRISGNEYVVPVTYWEDGDRNGGDDHDLSVATHSGWWKNFRGNAPLRLCLRGEWVDATAWAVCDDDEVATFVHERLVEEPADARLLGIQFEGYDVPTPAELQPAVTGTVLVRIRLAVPPEPTRRHHRAPHSGRIG
ncbi:nitroreductase/quinone reductase family protein [Haloarchaeobius sp. DFWS5]|uniref:nitroreductase/quinone reductase family protein n=1 Tax=Haloarchaeobius sp. DFWS5 TaxID=3446114 RepID=UPI003EB75158